MARKRKDKEKITDPFERARLKKLRAAQRREERKKRRAEGGDEPRRKREAAPEYDKPMVKDDYLWIRRGLAKNYAMRIINDHKERPYWLSIPHEYGDGVLPVTNFYPCLSFRTKKRAYFGFLFREHRDLFFDSLEDARKELTARVRDINPQLF